MAGRNHSEKTTKELILDAAFSFCNEPRLTVFSMSELAAKVGISKPAIYRHFADKDAVLAAMYERFISTLANYLLKVQVAVKDKESAHTAPLPVEAIAEIIQFFADHPFYVNYMLGSMASNKNFEFTLTKELELRGVQMLAGFACKQGADEKLVIKDFDRYVQTVYCGVTIFSFIKGREKLAATGKPLADAKEFSRKVTAFLVHGLSGTTEKDDALFPQLISDARMAELDTLCTISEDTLPAENRFFTAFASVIRKYKFTGITVEKIATELNMAKSSLYEYFDNKNEMIKTLIAKELSLLDTIIKENIVEARSVTEYLYIVMRTMFSFFMLRSSLIPICGWLLMSSADEAFFHEFDSTNPWIERLPNPLVRPDFGLPVRPQDFVAWIACLPISLVMQCAERSLSQEKMLSALKMMFTFVKNGIENSNERSHYE